MEDVKSDNMSSFVRPSKRRIVDESGTQPPAKRPAVSGNGTGESLKATVEKVAVGKLGKDLLKKALGGNRNPLDVIREFQDENGLRAQCNATPLLPLLDLVGVDRSAIYLDILKMLRSTLLPKLPKLQQHQLHQLVPQTFPYIQLPDLSTVAFEVLRLTKSIPPQYIAALSKRPELLEQCHLDVKRQVWQAYPQMFKVVAGQYTTRYIQSNKEEASRITFEELGRMSPRGRRDNEDIRKLLELIGNSLKLYDTTLEMIRSAFVDTGDLGYCSLRNDIVMRLQDGGNSSLFKLDPCHRFIECLVSCVADRNIDEARAEELGTFFDSIDVGPILGDIGMSILDPCVSHILAVSCTRVLQSIVNKAQMPATSKHLFQVTRVVVAATNTREMIKSQQFASIEYPQRLTGSFYPTLACMVMENRISQKTKEPWTSIAQEQVEGIREGLIASPGIRAIVMHYILNFAKVEQFLPVPVLIQELVLTDGHWRYGSGGEDSLNEQFARTLTIQLENSVKTFTSDSKNALELLKVLYIPRCVAEVNEIPKIEKELTSHEDSDTTADLEKLRKSLARQQMIASSCHRQALRMLKICRSNMTKPTDKAQIDKLVGDICSLDFIPDPQNVSMVEDLQRDFEFLRRLYDSEDATSFALDKAILSLANTQQKKEEEFSSATSPPDFPTEPSPTEDIPANPSVDNGEDPSW